MNKPTLTIIEYAFSFLAIVSLTVAYLAFRKIAGEDWGNLVAGLMAWFVFEYVADWAREKRNGKKDGGSME